MIPAAIVAMDAIPLLPNGKVDRRALPDPVASDAPEAGAVVPPATATEAALAALWADVLGRDTAGIGRTQNYFALGGDSISAIRVATRAAAAGLPLSVRDLFEAPTPPTSPPASTAPRLRRAPTCRSGPASRCCRSRPIASCASRFPRPCPRRTPARHSTHSGAATTSSRDVWSAAARTSCSPSRRGRRRRRARFAGGAETVDGLVAAVTLAAHPLLVDAAGWRLLVADLRALLEARALPPRGPALALAPPTPVSDPLDVTGPVLAGGPDLDLADLLASADRTLRADGTVLLAAAVLRAARGTALDGAVGLVLAERPEGAGALVTRRERVVRLPAAGGDLVADVRAVKAALRADAGDAGGDVGLTVRLVGGADFAGCALATPVLPRAAGAPPHLELALADGVLTADLHGAEAGDAAAAVAGASAPRSGTSRASRPNPGRRPGRKATSRSPSCRRGQPPHSPPATRTSRPRWSRPPGRPA